mgnify:CR=1 FL=1
MSSILVVSEVFYPEGSGTELATYLILKLLSQRGFKITVVTGSSKPAKIPHVKYYVMPYLRYSNRIVKAVRLKLLINNPVFIKLLREHDILYIPQYTYFLIPIAKKMGLKVIVHFHNYTPVRPSAVKYFFEPDRVAPFDELRMAILHEYYAQASLLRALLSPLPFMIYLLVDRKPVELADKIICVSHRQAEIVARNNPRLTNKVEVVYNPTSTGDR